MELPVKFNNPLFGHFNSKFSIKQDRYLEYILNEPFINEVYDVFIRALTVLEKEEPNNGIRFSLDGEKSDQKFLNDAFAICAACWVRPDPHNMLGSPYEVYNGDPYRQYYNDAVSCIAYAILSHQTALPEVAKRLMMAISLRADGDVYFWPLFKEFCDRKKAEGDYDDFNFMQILTYKPVILLPWDNGMEDLERDMNNKENSYHGLAIIQGYEQYLNEECENMSEEEREKWKVKLREYRNQMYKIQDRPITLTFADCFEMVDDYRDYLAAKSPMTEIEKPVIGNLISKEEHDAAIEKMQTEINEAQNAADVIQKKYDNLLIKYSSDTKTLEEKLKETEKEYEEAYNAYLLNQHILDEIQGNNEQEVHYKNRSQKITSSALFQLIVRARGDNNPVELMNTDASKMISYFTQYSPESIRQDLSCNVLNKRNREEAEKVTAEMKRLGINITIE